MPKPTVGPFCKYHHDTPMVPTGTADNPKVYITAIIENKVIQLGQGYTFHIYECPKCTYIELHDNAPK